jgi:hypothetical protein
MTKLTIVLAATAAIGSGLALPAAPALAQQNQAEVIVYGNDPCPRSTESSIVVCRRVPENQRYRLPQSQRESGTRQQRQAWANKSRQIQSLGATGINSCSAVGPGGYTGCLTQQIRQARQENREETQQSEAPEQP